MKHSVVMASEQLNHGTRPMADTLVAGKQTINESEWLRMNENEYDYVAVDLTTILPVLPEARPFCLFLVTYKFALEWVICVPVMDL